MVINGLFFIFQILFSSFFLIGCQNNPFGVLTQQMSHSMHILGSRCDIFVKSEAIPKVPDSRMELHFNSILDILSDWRRKEGFSFERTSEQLFLKFRNAVYFVIWGGKLT